MNNGKSENMLLPEPMKLNEVELELVAGGGIPALIVAGAAAVAAGAALYSEAREYIKRHTAPEPMVIVS